MVSIPEPHGLSRRNWRFAGSRGSVVFQIKQFSREQP
jgi:hypothetical protein